MAGAAGLDADVRRQLVAVDIGLKVATVGLLAWAVLYPDLPQFQGKALTGRALAYPIALLAVPVLWWLFGRGTLAPVSDRPARSATVAV